MIFFTRDLYDGYQPGSKWQRRAMRIWDRNIRIYRQYLKVIKPLLPTNIVKWEDISLHDCRVCDAIRNKTQIQFVLDTENAIGLAPDYTVLICFKGVKNKVGLTGLRGAWWLYDEVHLSHISRFAYHIFLDRKDLEVYADDFSLKLIRDRKLKEHRTPIKPAASIDKKVPGGKLFRFP